MNKEKTEQYKCQSYYDGDNILQSCTCGKCGKNWQEKLRYVVDKAVIWDIHTIEFPEVEQFIKDLLASQLEELEGKIEKLRSECTCGCNFKDGCLCKEEKRGFDKCKVQVKSIIKERNG